MLESGDPVLNLRRRVFIWFILIFLSIVGMILGYIYAYAIFPENILRLGFERLSGIAREASEISKSFSFDHLLRLAIAIFINNAVANLLFMLPFLGLIIYAYVVTFTGAVLRFYIDHILIGGKYSSPKLGILLTLLATPHTYIEFLAYAITITESIIFSISLVRTRVTRRNTLSYLAMLGLSYFVLFIAAFVEALTIFLINP
jgi:hypothetical protein